MRFPAFNLQHSTFNIPSLFYLCQLLSQKAATMKKVLGLGNALVDIMTQLDHDGYLDEFKLPKGSMILVDAQRSDKIYDETVHLQKTIRSGGSAANTVHGLAGLGVETGFIGKIGNDEMGKIFHDDMISAGINAQLSQSNTSTGRAIALVSPDTERTFATYLGAAVELNSHDLSSELFSQYDIFHIEGYIVQNHALLEATLKMARETGMMISLDLASYNVVDDNRDFLEKMLKKYVDIVFANEDEARSLTFLEPRQAVNKLAEMCEIAVVKVGKEGSLVVSRQSSAANRQSSVVSQKYEIGIIPVTSIDTTGAGDLYASGFLFGMANGYSLDICGRIGAILAGKVIEMVGPKLDEEGWREVKRMVGEV
jgi:sugar/nucleoside kinase (ribokinase family)